MGYANIIPYQMVEIASHPNAPITITTVTSTQEVGYVKVPTFTQPLAFAFLDMHVTGATDTSGAENYFSNDGQISVSDGVGVKRLAGYPIIGNCKTPANSYTACNQMIPGTQDIKAYITSGMNLHVYFDSVTSVGNNLVLTSPWSSLRLYFSVV